ncbi:MAG TPA: hypothetical protein VL172_16090 [Kofleriaceae bacterium]|nr:hypothetical protein [Kofleriaceae bacterium]
MSTTLSYFTRALPLSLILSACGGGTSDPDADLSSYALPCAREPDSCPPPYRCTAVDDVDRDAGTRDVCLIPCDSADDCPDGCVCNGVGGTDTSFGPDFICSCP